MSSQRPRISMSLVVEGLVVHAFLLGWAWGCLSWAGSLWSAGRPGLSFFALAAAGFCVPLVGLSDWWALRRRDRL